MRRPSVPSSARLGAVPAVFVLALVAAGCTGSGNGAVSATAAPASSSPSATASTPQPSASASASAPRPSSQAPSPSTSRSPELRFLPTSVVEVPPGYTLRPLPVGLDEIKRQLGPTAAAFTGLLNSRLLRDGTVVGTVQLFRLVPEAAEVGDELLPGLLDGYTQGARTTSAVYAGQRVSLARNVRGSGLDVAAWLRGSEVVLVAASPQRADLRAVSTSIIRSQRR